MRRSSTVCMALAFVAASMLLAFAADQKRMSVQIKQGELREAPSFLSKIVAELAYGDGVEAEETKESWVKAKLPGKETAGWMHASALTPKRIVFSAGEKDVETKASGSELALAGKGFNAQVEKGFRSARKDLDYSMVEKMEAIKTTPEQLAQFLREGGLRAGLSEERRLAHAPGAVQGGQ